MTLAFPKPERRKKSRKGFAPKSRKPPASEADKAHLMAVKGLPCCICGAPPPSQAHHCISGRWGSHKPDHRQTIPLCIEHHQNGPKAIHNGKKPWEKKHGKDTDYIAETIMKIYGEWK